MLSQPVNAIAVAIRREIKKEFFISRVLVLEVRRLSGGKVTGG